MTARGACKLNFRPMPGMTYLTDEVTNFEVNKNESNQMDERSKSA